MSVGPLTPEEQTGMVDVGSDSESVSSYLEGNVELKIILPDRKSVQVTIERRMPMLDLLIHIGTVYKINPASHQINVVSTEGRELISYKPSTPIGSLNSTTIQIVHKEFPSKRNSNSNAQPFEKTFRLQVHLPHQQLLVIRVSPQARLLDIFQTVCQQKDLDPSRYVLQHPESPELPLDVYCSLARYNLSEINIVAKRSSQALKNFTTNIPEKTSHEINDKKQKSFGIKCRNNKSFVGDSSSDDQSSRGVSPTRSDSDQISVSPSPALSAALTSFNRPLKKRVAPMPPSIKPRAARERPPPPPPLHPQAATRKNKDQLHSRQSSDSSGYHESTHDESPENLEVKRLKILTSVTNVIGSSNKKRRAPQPPSATTNLSSKADPTIASATKVENNPKDEHSIPTALDSPSSISNSFSSSTEIGQSANTYHATEDPELSNDSIVPEENTLITPDPPSFTPSGELSSVRFVNTDAPTSGNALVTMEFHNHTPNAGILNEVVNDSVDHYEEEEAVNSKCNLHATSDSAVTDLDASVSSTRSSTLDRQSPELLRQMKVVAGMNNTSEFGSIIETDDGISWHSIDVEAEEKQLQNTSDLHSSVSLKFDDLPVAIEDEKNESEKGYKSENAGQRNNGIKDELEETNRRNYDWDFAQPPLIAETDDWTSEDDEMAVSSLPPLNDCCIDDITASFEQVIADAEDALRKEEEEEEERREMCTSPDVDFGKSAQPQLEFNEKYSETAINERGSPTDNVNLRHPLQNFSIDTYACRTNDTSKTSKTLTKSESLGDRPSVEDVKKESRNPSGRSNSFQDKRSSVKFKIVAYDSSERLFENKKAIFSGNDEVDSKKRNVDDVEKSVPALEKSKSKSMVNLTDGDNFELKRTLSDQGMMNVAVDSSLSLPEQEECLRLQNEYLKLQRQFLLSWQQQLISNQQLLQRQRILPQNLLELSSDLFSLASDAESELSRSSEMKKVNAQMKHSTEGVVVSHDDYGEKKVKEILTNQTSSAVPSSQQYVRYKPVVKVQSMKEGPVAAINKKLCLSPQAEKSEKEHVNFYTSSPGEERSSLLSVKDRVSLFLNKRSVSDPATETSNKSETLPRGEVNRLGGEVAKATASQLNSGNKFQRQRINGTEKKNERSVQVPFDCNGNSVELQKSRANENCRSTQRLKADTLPRTAHKEIPLSIKTAQNQVLRNINANKQIKSNVNKNGNRRQLLSSKEDSQQPPQPPPLPLQRTKLAVGAGSNTKSAVKPTATPTADTRDLLMDAIREFGGRNNLRKVPKSQTLWVSWHGSAT